MTTESIAAAAFADAERLLHALPFESPRMPPPLELEVPVAPELGPTNGASPLAKRSTPVIQLPILTKGPTLTEALSELEAGTLTTRELVEQAISISKEFAACGGVVSMDEESALAQADTLDAERRAGKLRGPLHGIPMTVKDIIDVAGFPTRAGSLAYDDVPKDDAVAVSRLRLGGALMLAKVATHEFALGVTTPQCRNPHDVTRISGGSSGGSAIAVSTGIGLASLGTDTRASLRVPAALCGVVGFKPTFGRVPAKGIVPLSWSIDHLGPIARTVEDAAHVFNVLADAPFLDTKAAMPEKGFVVGIVDEVFADADPDVAAACEAALGVLERLGCTIASVAGPTIEDLECSNALGLLVSRSEASAFHRSQGTDLDKCIPEVRDQLRAGLKVGASDYIDAQRQREVLSQKTVATFSTCDLIVAPTSPVVAPPYEDYEAYLLRLSRNTIIWSLVGAPAVSVPCGSGNAGLPVGLQIAARPGREQDLVTVGIAFEQAIANGR